MHPLQAISPIDGRYQNKTAPLQAYFSEYALIRYRVRVELKYFLALCRLPLPALEQVSTKDQENLLKIHDEFLLESAQRVKEIEKITNHDVKAVEYYIKEAFDKLELGAFKEFIHFGLTSQDINNTAIPLSLKDALTDIYLPALQDLRNSLDVLAQEWKGIPMLAKTHGQPASPTLLGKEIAVFVARLDEQTRQLQALPIRAKFGGATGNLNAHYVAYPEIDWHDFAKQFVETDLGLERAYPTTQIEHYDNLGAVCHNIMRIHTILIDFCRDIWTYISMEYFRQKTIAGEIGSSAMPHKVNPIDFENAEGNLGVANATLGHLAEKLPVSRLQRDLTDSTVLRNIGVPFSHGLIAITSMQKGLKKLLLNEDKLKADLEANWMVTAEAIQTVLRRESYPQPYEALKMLTRGKASIGQKEIHNFIDQLDVSDNIKQELKAIRPDNFVGKM